MQSSIHNLMKRNLLLMTTIKGAIVETKAYSHAIQRPSLEAFDTEN